MLYLSKGLCHIEQPWKQSQQLPLLQPSLEPFLRRYRGIYEHCRAEKHMKWLWQTHITAEKKMVWVSLETTLIHKSRRLVEPQSTEWQNNSGTGSPCWRYVHVNSLFTHPAVAATFEPQVHGKCVIPVKYSCGVWCWSLWWCFLAGWLKKSNQKTTKKNPKPPPHIRAHGGALQSQPCFHRDAEVQPITQREAAQDDSHAQPGHQLKCPTQINPVSSCIQFKRQAGMIPIISISPLFSSFFPTYCRDTQLSP